MSREGYDAYRSKYRISLQHAKRSANDRFVNNSVNSSAAAWKIINGNRKQIISPAESISPDEFVNYFTDVPSSISNLLPLGAIDPLSYFEDCNLSFELQQVTFNEVRDAVARLKNTKAKDVYGINVKILKTVINVILIPLTKLINLCLKSSTFPTSLKLAKVTPVYKKGSRLDPSNYRPISVLPLIGKVFERLLYNQISAYFETNNLFQSCQYGFRNNRSTTLAVTSLCQHVTQAFEQGQHLHAHFYDLQKAFDCLSHGILINKLRKYGFRDSSLQLLRSYLDNRSQYVCVGGNQSEVRQILTGVPQGSVLGPILFLAYINDLPCCTDSGFVLFADDTTTFASDHDIVQLQSRVNIIKTNIQDWFIANRLCLNTNKTQHLLFSLRTPDYNAAPVRFLGIYLDQGLTWEVYVDHLCAKLAKQLFAIRQLRDCVSLAVLNSAYYGLFHANVNYAILAWGHSAHTSRVFRLQRKCIRVMTGMPFRSDCRHQFIDLKILTVPCLYLYASLLYIKDNLDSYSSYTHPYITRHRDNLVPTFHRLLRSREATGYFGIAYLNKLLSDVRQLPRAGFARVIKDYLAKNVFYSTNEYLGHSFKL